MNHGYQMFIATGTLGADPVVKAIGAGGVVAEIRLAIDELFHAKDGTEHRHTEWVHVRLFDEDARIAQRRLAKGRLVTIEGRLHTDRTGGSAGEAPGATWVHARRGGLTLHGSDHTTTSPAHGGRPAVPSPSAMPTQNEDDDALPL
ncbi:single stranded DNA-binding protein [Xanthomonas sp. F1]|uniref:single-stranded DNA-binding protein n=1 Tax=Xanthomonas sp. LMG 8992 TaxID=1591157 RepID=UPI00136CF4FB